MRGLGKAVAFVVLPVVCLAFSRTVQRSLEFCTAFEGVG